MKNGYKQGKVSRLDFKFRTYSRSKLVNNQRQTRWQPNLFLLYQPKNVLDERDIKHEGFAVRKADNCIAKNGVGTFLRFFPGSRSLFTFLYYCFIAKIGARIACIFCRRCECEGGGGGVATFCWILDRGHFGPS